MGCIAVLARDGVRCGQSLCWAGDRAICALNSAKLGSIPCAQPAAKTALCGVRGCSGHVWSIFMFAGKELETCPHHPLTPHRHLMAHTVDVQPIQHLLHVHSLVTGAERPNTTVTIQHRYHLWLQYDPTVHHQLTHTLYHITHSTRDKSVHTMAASASQTESLHMALQTGCAPRPAQVLPQTHV